MSIIHGNLEAMINCIHKMESLLEMVIVSMVSLERIIMSLEANTLSVQQVHKDDPRLNMYKTLIRVILRLNSDKDFLSEINQEARELNKSLPIEISANLPKLLDQHVKILEKIETNLKEMTIIGQDNHAKLSYFENLMSKNP